MLDELVEFDSEQLLHAAGGLPELVELPAFKLLRACWEAEWRRAVLQLEGHTGGSNPTRAVESAATARAFKASIGMVDRVLEAARVAERAAREAPDG
jgi:hypothetical protein